VIGEAEEWEDFALIEEIAATFVRQSQRRLDARHQQQRVGRR